MAFLDDQEEVSMLLQIKALLDEQPDVSLINPDRDDLYDTFVMIQAIKQIIDDFEENR